MIVNVSYWHYWLSLNEQAIKPLHEAKSDLEIASLLSTYMNKKRERFMYFPSKNIIVKKQQSKSLIMEFMNNLE